MREVVGGVMYVLSTGYQWRYIPNLPRSSTVNGYFCLWGSGMAHSRGFITLCSAML
jgi:hypothetical protein